MQSLASLLNLYAAEHDLADVTVRTHRTRLLLWGRLTDGLPPESVVSRTFRQFRKAAILAGYSSDYTEDVARTAAQLLRFAAAEGLLPAAPEPGRGNRKRQVPRYVPPLEDLGKLYAAADAAQWPTFCQPGDFWRTVLCVGYWTALRRHDLFFRLNWSCIGADRINALASKTGKCHAFPLSPVVARHLDSWRASCAAVRESAGIAAGVRLTAWATRIAAGRVFPVGNCTQQIRREFHRLSAAAGVKVITPQAIRRLSCTEWQAARWGAGEVIQGAALRGSSRYYIVPRILAEAAPLVAWPSQMLTAEERDKRQAEELTLLESFRRLDERDRLAVAALAERLAG